MAGRRARAVRPARRPDPEPLEIDESRVIAIGSALWFVAWAVLLISHDSLEDRGNEWYIWTAATGLGLGLWGWWLVRHRVADRAARRVEPPVEAAVDAPAGPRAAGRRRRAPKAP